MRHAWWTRAHALGIGLALLAVTLAPMAATAQSGPQFGNWGPGMAPPEPEGVDTSPASGAGGANYGAAPSSAAAPDSAMAPAPGILPRGCPYDLRGVWRNEGRQYATGSSSSQPYSTTVYVRQYRTWIQAQQEDGISYYGQCLGNRVMFDMYRGPVYVGRQEGMIYGTPWYAPVYPPVYPPVPMPMDLYGGPAASTPAAAAPAPAAAAPAPGSTPVTFYPRPDLTIGYSWTATYGSGSETWTLTSPAFPGPINPGPILYPPPLPASPTATPTATATPAPTTTATTVPSPTPVSSLAPRIDALLPARGPAGTEVVLQGSGFLPADNLVLFGPSLGLQHPDGTPANLVVRGSSPDGVTLRFTVPATGPSGILCDAAGNCVGVSAIQLPQPASYEVTVNNANGTSNAARFELMGEPITSVDEPDLSVDAGMDEAEVGEE